MNVRNIFRNDDFLMFVLKPLTTIQSIC